MAKIMFLDLETTGFSTQWDYILEIAAIIYDEETRTKVAQFHELAKPGKNITAKIFDITGISNQMVANCRTEKQVLMDFTEWLEIQGVVKWAGHNVKSFDKRFVIDRSAKYGLVVKAPEEIIDTLTIARRLSKAGKISVENHKQPTICEFYGINYDAHRAINDVHANIEMYEKMGLNQTKSARREKEGF